MIALDRRSVFVSIAEETADGVLVAVPVCRLCSARWAYYRGFEADVQHDPRCPFAASTKWN